MAKPESTSERLPRPWAGAVIGSLVALLLIAASIDIAAASADWSVQGSLQAGIALGCGSSPSCTSFTTLSEDGCDPQFALADGLDTSIVPLPSEAQGAEALLTWTSTGSINGSVGIGWLGTTQGRCFDLGSSVLPPMSSGSAFFGYGSFPVRVNNQAEFAYVTGSKVIDLDWRLSPA